MRPQGWGKRGFEDNHPEQSINIPYKEIKHTGNSKGSIFVGTFVQGCTYYLIGLV